ncbi:manganese-dependent ADP-ribose/CDP-alcohol diphosphatase [Scomber scombrus]|uniref:Manganese-dependent ADP-ribose/CDP-alcohol diphosphatase n=1 Tax=Scomber scombrus TaxID=13677 RepID=A0AAV1PGZ6_SCOSC
MDDCCQQTPLFTFGVIADIQYADIDDGFNYSKTRKRYYRSSLELLRNARESWSESAVKPQFILQLGDIIDGFNKEHNASQQALDSVLRELSSSPVEVHHVWGNHEFYNFSRSVLLRSKLNSTLHVDRSFTGAQAGGEIYAYHFSPFPGFRFVVLDAYDVSLLGREESSEQYATALKLIKLYNSNEDLNCPPGKAVAEGGLRERIPELGAHGVEGPASQSGQFGVWDGEEVAVGGSERVRSQEFTECAGVLSRGLQSSMEASVRTSWTG